MLNFSMLEHCCRKCLCSRQSMLKADSYLQIHAKNCEPRSNAMLRQDFDHSQEIGVTHVNGVGHRSLFFEFPYFDIPTMLPQCASHDYLGTIQISSYDSFHSTKIIVNKSCSELSLLKHECVLL